MLRSLNDLKHGGIAATDGPIGEVSDCCFDDDSWLNWWMGQQVRVSSSWINSLRWADQSVTVGLSREAIRSAPVFESTEALNRARKASLYGHQQRPGCWTTGGLPPLTG